MKVRLKAGRLKTENIDQVEGRKVEG